VTTSNATWTFVGGPVIKDGQPVDFGSFLIPITDYRIEDVWHVVGLKGIGSNTLVVKDVFVPRHRFLSYKSMNDHTAAGLATNTDPVYRMPWGTMHPTTITAPIVGMAYGAYESHVEHQGQRVRAAFAGEKSTTSSGCRPATRWSDKRSHRCLAPTFPPGSTRPTRTSTPNAYPSRSSPSCVTTHRSGGVTSPSARVDSTTAASGW
jgi:hypothetical protein